MGKFFLNALAGIYLIIPQMTIWAEETQTHLTIDSKVIFHDSLRLGLNLGYATFYGSEQFFNNILANPGFEGDIDRVIIIVDNSNEHSFTEDSGGYPDDYWNGAIYEVHSGLNRGMKGVINRSVQKGEHQKPEFFSDKSLPKLTKNDVIVLTKIGRPDSKDAPIPSWWVPRESLGKVEIVNAKPRPDGGGKNSLKMSPLTDAPAEIQSYLDTINERAGNLLPVNGKWTISFWAKAENANSSKSSTLNLYFARLNGSTPFFAYSVHPKEEWQYYSFEFDAVDSDKKGPLKFQFQAVGNQPVLIDDVYLGPFIEGQGPIFRQEVVDMLKFLKPSFIRDHQGQMGDTFENRISERFNRMSTSIRAFYGNRNLLFNYSIGELLTLCKDVNSNPWIVCPTVFNDEEALNFGKYLAKEANTSIFSDVYVEFGNENWNYLFRTLGIPIPEVHGAVAENIFSKIKEGAEGHVKLTCIVNGQHASPAAAFKFLDETPSADALAIAPYFFTSLDKDTPEKTAIAALFQNDGGLMKQLQEMVKADKKRLMLYELNMHTDGGSATAAEKNHYISSSIAGSALAKKVIEAALIGIQPQMIFTFSQFDSKGDLRLWGITRDLGPTKRVRPTGLVMHLFNLAMQGQMHALHAEDSFLTGVAYQTPNGWQAAIVSTDDKPRLITLTFPEGDEPLPNIQLYLSSENPFNNNEDAETVTIGKKKISLSERKATFTLPPYGFVVLIRGGDN